MGLLMPEADSSPDSVRLARLVVGKLGIRSAMEDMSGILEAAGCYRRRDEAIRTAIPGFGEGWRSKIVLSDIISRSGYPVFSVVARAPSGEEVRKRLPLDAYLGVAH